MIPRANLYFPSENYFAFVVTKTQNVLTCITSTEI